MNVHKNARTAPVGRERIVRLVIERGQTPEVNRHRHKRARSNHSALPGWRSALKCPCAFGSTALELDLWWSLVNSSSHSLTAWRHARSRRECQRINAPPCCL
jgi:hypothetical protein